MHGEAGTFVCSNRLLQVHSRPDVDVAVSSSGKADVSRLSKRHTQHAVDLGNRTEATATVGESTTCHRPKLDVFHSNRH